MSIQAISASAVIAFASAAVGVASMAAIPPTFGFVSKEGMLEAFQDAPVGAVGVAGGIFLSEYPRHKLMPTIRMLSDVLAGIPAIVMGLVAYGLVVLKFGFSGLAGAYATITRKGEAIVGVAIATALMPPLATVGFGLATLNGAVALFVYLVIAISQIALRRRATTPSPLRMWFFPWATYAVIAFIVFVIVAMIVDPDQLSAVGLSTALAVIVVAASVAHQKRVDGRVS